MSDPVPSRKSGRQRVPNRKYRDDAFETLKTILSSDEDDEVLRHQSPQDDSDAFPETQGAEDDEDEDEDGDGDGDGSLTGDGSDGSAIVTPVEENVDAYLHASPDPGSPIIPKPIKSKLEERSTQPNANHRFRGMAENPLKKDEARSIVKLFAGEGLKDISHITKSRDQWVTDPTLPRRSRLHRGFSHTDEKHHMEATVGWDWYYVHGARERFSARQNMRTMTVEEARPYCRFADSDQEFLLGPYGRQSKYMLAPAQSVELSHAWTSDESAGKQRKRERQGWILNVGETVKCLDWAPQIGDRKTQYLALANAPPSLAHSRESPAFTPFPGKSAIHLWIFPATLDRGDGSLPYLCSILCADWGEIKQLKWCPVPRTARKVVSSDGQMLPDEHMGLLAIICGDGSARVLDVRHDFTQSMRSLPQAQKYNNSSFVVPAPNGNVSTCIAWLSSTDIAIGYSNGLVRMYNICPQAELVSVSTQNGHERHGTDAAAWRNPLPWLSMSLHTTYILALTSAYPTHPSLLLSSSLSGHLRLTSLLAPKTDYVFSSRTRSPPSSLAYCDPLMAVVGAEESSDTLRIWGLRCFYAHFSCAKLPASPGPGHGVVDVGKCHPTIATGGADGSVVVTNPLRKILGKKQAGYQQCIFRHEWRSKDTTIRDRNNHCHRQGLVRFTEGYRAEKVNLGSRYNAKQWKESVPTTTIFEEETAVTALAWNPNLSCGGWLAVGWCSGLVRVQDLAID